jgi:hypothetical protein
MTTPSEWTKDIIETMSKDEARPLNTGEVRIVVPILFYFVFGRVPHPVFDAAKLAVFANAMQDRMTVQAHRWRHRLMTTKHLAELRSMLLTYGQQLRDEGI